MALLDTIRRALVSPAEAPAKAATGPGVTSLMYDPPVWQSNRNPNQFFRQAQLLYHTHFWINKAERTVTNRVTGLDWHLEDENDEEYHEDAPDEVRAIHDLLEKPQANLGEGRAQQTRRDLWALTSRHLGLCGNAFWYLDETDFLAGRPLTILYVNPARMTPVSDQAGHLVGWKLDADSWTGEGGTPLELAEVLHFRLDPPDWGHFGVGLVEASGMKADLVRLADRHASGVLGSGGRLSGMLAPAAGTTMEPDAFAAVVRDYRAIVEDPNSAKKLQILRHPMDYTRTAATPQEINLLELMERSRDDILTYWGVPLTMVGAPVAVGLNSGDSKVHDESVLMQGTVHDRVEAMREVIQYQLLDRWQKVGLAVEMVIEEPVFDDLDPAYERATKSQYMPMTNRERRELIGLEPIGDDFLDNAILLPATMLQWATAPVAGKPIPQTPVDTTPETVEQEQLPAKARPAVQRSFLGLREAVEENIVPAIDQSVSRVLAEMRTDVVGRIRRNLPQIMRKPTDHQPWWPKSAGWNEALLKALRPHAAAVAQMVTKQADEVLQQRRGAKAEPFSETVSADILARVGERITGINETTRDRILAIVQATVASGLDRGLSPSALGDELEDALAQPSLFGPARAELIARTEAMQVYNEAALQSYAHYGVVQVQAIDGDVDAECAARDGRTYPVDEAYSISDHPNGTLDWVPIVEPLGKAEPVVDIAESMRAAIRTLAEPPVVNVPAPVVNVAAPPAPQVVVDTSAFATALEGLREMLAAQAAPRERRIIRDEAGRIVGLEG